MSARRWPGRGARARPEGGADELETLRAELALLREENANLKAARHREPGLGALVAHARALPDALDAHEEAGDGVAHMLAEAMVIREALLDTCRQIELAMAAVRAKLDQLAAVDAAAR